MTDRELSPAQWWRPGRLASRRANLDARQTALRATRRFFEDRGYAEVETPALQVSPGLEPHLTAFATELIPSGGTGPPAQLHLHTSPEFAMKKLLAAGEARIFQTARVYRNAERSATHHPEFTMLEWYRAGAGWRDLAEETAAYVRAVFAATGRGAARRGVRLADIAGDWEWLSVAEAFERHARIDLLATAPDPLAPDAGRLRAAAEGIGIRCAAADTWEDIFFRVFLDRIEPGLGAGAPTILHSYPASMAALSRISPGDARVCERFEVFICGLELANGYGELTDAHEQRRRFAIEVARREALGTVAYPVDEDLLASLDAGLPDCAGIALGFDRLVMLITGAERIEEVLWAPVVEP